MSDHKVEIDVRLNMDKVGKDFDELKEEAKSGAQSVGNTLDGLSDDMDGVGKGAKDMGNQYSKAADEMKGAAKEAEQSTDNLGDSVQGLGDQLDTAKDKASVFGDVLKGSLASAAIEKGIGVIASGLETAVSGALELEDANNKLAASTGATAEEMEQYSDVLEDLYKNNYGDSISDVADSMALVRQYTGEVDPSKLEELTENALALTDTFDMDLGESIRGVDSLMTNMGLSAEEAYDYIAVGAQNGLDKSGELTDNIAEYGQLWGQAGFSAQEMFTILQNGLDNGAYNLDKVNDFVKEFAISLSDGRIEENLGSFSEGTQSLFEQWKNGEATTKDVFYSVINDLASMTNKQEALTVASNTWSALGEDNAMAIITSLDDVNDTYKDVHGSMEDLKKVRYDSITNQYKQMGRTFQTDVMQPILVKFLPVAQKGIKVLADNVDKIVPIAGAAGTAMATIWITKKASKLIGSLKDTAVGVGKVITQLIAQTAATGTATVAQEGLNVAMSANPIGLVITGISALVAGVAAFKTLCPETASETETLGQEIKEMGEAASEAQEEIQGAMETASQSVGEAEARAAMAGDLAGELEVLAQKVEEAGDKTALTNEEQNRMTSLVSQLNALYPEMGLEIDSVTGKLNMSSQEMKNYVDNLQKMALAEANQRAAADLYDVVVEKTKELTDAQQIEKAAYEELTEKKNLLAQAEQKEIDRVTELEQAQKDYQTALQKGSPDIDKYEAKVKELESGYFDLNGEMVTYNQVQERLINDVDMATAAHDDAKESVKELQDAVDSATKEANGYLDAANDVTAANEEEVQGVSDLNRSYYDNVAAQQAQQEAAQMSISVAGQEVEAFNNLSVEQQQLAVEVTNAVTGMQQNVQDYLGATGRLFEEFADTSSVSTTDLLNNMQSQVEGVKTWQANITALMDTTKTYIDETGQEVQVELDEGLVQYLMDMGPEGAAYAQAFVNMSGEELAQANALWSEKVGIENFTNTEGEKLTQGVGEMAAGSKEAWNQLAEDMNAAASDSGEYVVQGMVSGMKNAADQIQEAGEEAGDSLLKSIDTSLGVSSPSKYAKRSGQYVGEGLVVGGHSKLPDIKSMGADLGQAAISGLEDEDLYGNAYTEGRNFGDGLIAGMASKTDQIAQQAASDVRNAINAAKNEQDSNSPAKETIKLGHDWGEGYTVGIADKVGDAAGMSASLVSATLSAARARNGWAIDAMQDAVYSRSASIGRMHGGSMAEVMSRGGGNRSSNEIRQLAKELGLIIAEEIGDMEFIFDQREMGRMVRKVS